MDRRRRPEPGPWQANGSTTEKIADMSASWLLIRVELVSGNGQRFWPRPGRIFLASPRHTFAHLADAIDSAFSRWDRAHLHQFFLDNGQVIGFPDDEDDPLEEQLNGGQTMLAHLESGAPFVYEFDFGDSWLHLCQREPEPADPEDLLGVTPTAPTAYWGWGTIPDQYGRRWADDDSTGDPPHDPGITDLPAIGPWQHHQNRPSSR